MFISDRTPRTDAHGSGDLGERTANHIQRILRRIAVTGIERANVIRPPHPRQVLFIFRDDQRNSSSFGRECYGVAHHRPIS
jgi:hypothetical protein